MVESSEFCTGSALSLHIKRIVGGENLRIATAFWSRSGVEFLFSDRSHHGVKILCDISLGATSREALEALNAPQNLDLRHFESLHSKVFISSTGLVVGSANVSKSALGVEGRAPDQIEAGTVHQVGSSAWQQASDWFDQIYERGEHVSNEQLKRAELLYRKPSRPKKSLTENSLLDLVVSAPWRFANVSFVVTSIYSDVDAVSDARKYAKENAPGFSSNEIDKWDDEFIFTGWENEIARGWQYNFVEFWIDSKDVQANAYRSEIIDRKSGSIFARESWGDLQELSGIEIPDQNKVGLADGDLIRWLAKRAKGDFYKNGEEISKKIHELVNFNKK